MTIIKISPTEPACYGMLCYLHEHCNRYHAAEGQPLATIVTCEAEDGSRPLFVQRVALVKLAAQAGQA